MPITIVQADITTLKVDAIVNAANESLLGGGGVDGRIHFVAGPELKAECAKLGGCAVGNAKLTKGYKLPAKYVIHTVGPRWKGGTAGERAKLASCYRRCLEVARAYDIHSIAFPAISTGAFGYPAEEAADVAITTIREEIEGRPLPDGDPSVPRPSGRGTETPYKVILCAYDGAAKQILTRRMMADG
jgi:O-acetyl-ADP-ribose deacetylase